MRRIIIYWVVLFGLFANATSLVAEERWEAAAAAYQEGDWQAALDQYLALQQAGYASAALDYNIGNCYYKIGGYLGKSILYYERALLQDPAFEDAAFNLAMAQRQTVDQIEQIPEIYLVAVLHSIREKLSADAWAWCALLLFAMTLLALFLFRYGNSRKLRKFAFAMMLVFLLLSIISGAFGLTAKEALLSDDAAVVTVPVSSVKSSPSATGNNLFVLHEGTKVEVLEDFGNWMRIELSDGRQGWIQKQEAEII